MGTEVRLAAEVARDPDTEGGGSHLRLVRSSQALPLTAGDACLNAFQQHLDYVCRTLRRLGAAASDVEDLAQDVFLALRGAWPDVDPTRPLRPYLFGVAFRITAAHRRKRKREVPFGTRDVADEGPLADDRLAARRARATVLSALEHIPLRRRAALIMHDIDGVPVQQIAKLLGIPRFTVYSRLRRARGELERVVRRLTRETSA
jgi:RNA polymerase sigma-70 factor (ECF subfamily)